MPQKDAEQLKRYVHIDGDLYLETLPVYEDLHSMIQANKKLCTAMDHKIVIAHYNPEGSIILGTTQPEGDGDHSPSSWGPNFFEEYIPEEDQYDLCYHPVLIPMKKDGSFDPYFRHRHQNGKLIHGGTFYYLDQKPNGGVEYTPLPIQLHGPAKEFDTKQYFIGDTTNGYEMEWICWDGLLFSRYAAGLADHIHVGKISILITSTVFAINTLRNKY